MTLYLWIHWFWITALCHYGVIGEVTTIYSIVTDITDSLEQNNLSNMTETEKKTASSLFPTPPNNIPSNSSVAISVQKSPKMKSQKPSQKKFGGFFTISVSPNVSKEYSSNETTVISQNISDKLLNTLDNQINTSITPINISNIYLGNETNFNDSQLLNSERIGIEEMEGETSGNLSAAGITGISLGCVIIVGVFCSISYFFYHNRGFNRPQVLNDRCSNPDSSGYLDDTSVRENSEEMYSLDNDSFLNSLEAMTIQNYWTDSVKHTKL
ncbi:hypothetical protein WA026_010494 [Henosepilachna vigintioctopunctata]|uniref:Mid2 domain-containing protein n=1 Tax=Henosepilachna vigintioctopunctata TaxID=420089 RepID=A0AAW1VEA7_9CUCU